MGRIELGYQIDDINKELVSLGYKEPYGTVLNNYDFATLSGHKGFADLIAFANPLRCDISTSCIAVKKWSTKTDKNDALRELSYIGAPLALFALKDKVEIWPVFSPDKEIAKSPQETLPYNRLSEYFDKNRNELSPLSLLRAKRKLIQLSFFHIDPRLESFARKATQEILVQQFQDAIRLSHPDVQKNNPKELIRVAIWVLSARILQDKLSNKYKAFETRDILVLFEELHKHFPQYFKGLKKDFKSVGISTVKTLYDGLLGDFTFRSLTNDMLAYFYENTLVNEQIREELGIYYTPRYITERILQRLPVEDLRPEDRTVLDGTCGSGNMLLSAYDRLTNLLPAKWTLEKRHNYLLEHIWGVDKDSFACEIARLSLLLYDLPAGDSWKIITGDVFDFQPQKIFKNRPHIIVGNPPFKDTCSTGGASEQKAALILDIYLNWLNPGGYLGIVIPSSLLNNESIDQSKTRKNILDKCDIFEIWNLPEGAIPGSTVSTSVILAKKHKKIGSVKNFFITRIEHVDRTDLKYFQDHQIPSFSYVSNQQQWHNNYKNRMISSQFDQLWKRLKKEFIAVEPEYCKILNGVQPGAKANKTHFSESPKSQNWRPVLRRNTNGKILEPYLINWTKQKDKYFKYPSDEIHRPRIDWHFNIKEKVIINATRNVGNPWRFYAAIDSTQYVIIENFHYILASKKVSVEVLTAIFNSMAANAWFACNSNNLNISNRIIGDLPFPEFTLHQQKQIRDIVRQISDMKKELSDKNIVPMQKAILNLDEIVFDAYKISKEERTQIKSWMNRFPRPGQEWHKQISKTKILPKIYEGRQWILTGQVISVEESGNSVSLMVNDKVENLPIPSTMPGWALRPDVAFEAIIPWEQRYQKKLTEITWLSFKPLGYDYLSDEELISIISNADK